MYKYVAKNKAGEVIRGEIDAPSSDQAMKVITASGLD